MIAEAVDPSATATFSGEGVTASIARVRGTKLRLLVTADPSAPAGLRDLTVTNPNGLSDTLADAIAVTGDTTPALGAVAGRVFEDVDGNGVQDGGETGLAGVVVSVSDADGGQATVNTDGQGDFVATGVAAGEAVVDVVGPAGYALTTGNDAQSVIVVEDTTVQADPVGYQPVSVASGAVAGRVFEDADGDGVEDGGEAGLAGVSVTVSGADGVDVTVGTDGQGDFMAQGVAVGEAVVAVARPAGYALTTGNDAQSVIVVEDTTVQTDAVGYQMQAQSLPGVYSPQDVHLLLDAPSLDLADGEAVSTWIDAHAGIEFVVPGSSDAPTFVASAGFGGAPSVEFDGVDDVLQASFGELNTNDFVFHLVLETVAYGHRTTIMTRAAGEALSTKHVIGYDDYDEGGGLRGEPSWVTMSGPNGTQAEHFHPILSLKNGDARMSPTADVLSDAHRVVITYVVRDSGQVRFWDRLDDVLDKTMSSPGNDLAQGLRLGSRENTTSHANFRLAYLIVVDEEGYSEDDLLLAAADLGAWFAVPGFDGD